MPVDLQLSGRTALVAASSRGIGRACATALGREGAHVVVSSSDADRTDEARAALASEGLSVESEVMDVSSLDDVHRAVGAVLDRVGRIDVLVANGPGPRPCDAADVDLDELTRSMTTTFVSAVALSRAVLPKMRANGFGRIILLSSSTAKEPDEGMVLSNVARAAVGAWGKTLAREVARDGVTVNAILTGSILSERSESLLRAEAEEMGRPYDAYLQEVEATIPAGYIAPPGELASVVAFLASPAAAYVNGVSLAVDGGWMRTV